MLAPRRVGKTSLMLRLQATATEKGFSAVYLSVADAASEINFVKKVFRAVAEPSGSENVFKRLRRSPAGKLLGRIRRVEVLSVDLELFGPR